MLGHMKKLLEIKGSKLLFGGEALENHSIPAVYGAIKPTAVFIPLEEILKENNYDLVTKEIFGPFQVYYILYSSIFSLFFFFWFGFTIRPAENDKSFLVYALISCYYGSLFQIVTEYKDNQLPWVLNAVERMHAHLTAAVVSNDTLFLQVSRIS